MSDTKDKIIQGSLQLFNELGFSNVSQRKIAEHLHISPGNLTYHFKKRDDIIQALYFKFIEQIEFQIKDFLKIDITLESFYSLIHSWFELMYRYRFIFIDISNLLRNDKRIQENYKEFVKVRSSIFLKIVNELIEQKIIRKEELSNEYNTLYQRLHLVSDFFLAAHYNNQRIKDSKKIEDHSRLFMEAIYPYLTVHGKKKYKLL